MNKAKRLKKSLIITGAVCGIAVIGGLAGVFILGGISEEADMQLMRLRSQRSTIEANNAAAIERSKTATIALETYKRINPQNNPLLGTLDRKTATLTLDRLNQQYQLRNLQLNISPASAQDHTPLQLRTTTLSHSTVALSFESLTDEFSLSFIRDMIASFPGFMHITTVTLTKNGILDEKTFYGTSRGEPTSLVKGEFNFEWLGLDINNKNEDAANVPAS
jgi:hypothetical protein